MSSANDRSGEWSSIRSWLRITGCLLASAACFLITPNLTLAQAESKGVLPVRELRARAQNGDADAGYELGRSLFRKDATPDALTEAVMWFRESAAKRHSKAALAMAIAYSTGRGVPVDQEEAIVWYLASASFGSTEAREACIDLVNHGEIERETLHDLQTWLGSKSLAASAPARHLASVDALSDDQEANDRTAAANLRGLSKEGHALSSLTLASLINEGVVRPVSLNEEKEMLEHAAQSDYAQAQLRLATMILTRGDAPTGQDLAAAEGWLRKAARSGDLEAITVYAEFLSEYRRDFGAAFRTYQTAIAQGYTPARLGLGNLLLRAFEQTGQAKFQRDGIMQVRVAAEAGIPEAQLMIGSILEEGAGNNAQILEEARRWYIRAAKAGVADAQHRLGVWYSNGRTAGTSNAVEAARWFALAVDNGHVNAILHLAKAYESGAGVPRNPNAAKALRERYRKAMTHDD